LIQPDPVSAAPAVIENTRLWKRMKNHPSSPWILRAVLGTICLVGKASAHPGHPGHDFNPSVSSYPDDLKLLLAVIVTTLALFVGRGVYKKLP
jgi:hypothetical protein